MAAAASWGPWRRTCDASIWCAILRCDCCSKRSRQTSNTGSDTGSDATPSSEATETEQKPLLAEGGDIELEVRRRLELERTFVKGKFIRPGSEEERVIAERVRREMGGKAPKQLSAEDEHPQECVICMDAFDSNNPLMPTLCGCGVSKTYFHLPCLLTWVETRSTNCPACRSPLYYEEHSLHSLPG